MKKIQLNTNVLKKWQNYIFTILILPMVVGYVFETPWLNFINVLCTAFTTADPKSIKKTVKLSIFFTHLGFTRVKAVSRMLMKLTPAFGSCSFTKHCLTFRSRVNWHRFSVFTCTVQTIPVSFFLPNY